MNTDARLKIKYCDLVSMFKNCKVLLNRKDVEDYFDNSNNNKIKYNNNSVQNTEMNATMLLLSQTSSIISISSPSTASFESAEEESTVFSDISANNDENYKPTKSILAKIFAKKKKPSTKRIVNKPKSKSKTQTTPKGTPKTKKRKTVIEDDDTAATSNDEDDDAGTFSTKNDSVVLKSRENIVINNKNKIELKECKIIVERIDEKNEINKNKINSTTKTKANPSSSEIYSDAHSFRLI